MDSRREFFRRASLYAAPLIFTVSIRPAFAQGPYDGPNGGNDDGPNGGNDDGPGEDPMDGMDGDPMDDVGVDPTGPAGDEPGEGTNEGSPVDDGGSTTRRGGSSDNWWERFIDQIEEI